MIKKHSDDPDVGAAAQQAYEIVQHVLTTLPAADEFDYGGHELHLGEYDVCTRCTSPIAETQQAHEKLATVAEKTEDETVREHLLIAADFFQLEAELAKLRAELHNGHGTEKILNLLLAFVYERKIDDSYDHSHNQGK